MNCRLIFVAALMLVVSCGGDSSDVAVIGGPSSEGSTASSASTGEANVESVPAITGAMTSIPTTSDSVPTTTAELTSIPTTSAGVPPATVVYPSEIRELIVSEPTISLEELSLTASTVLTGRVTSVESLGRPSMEEDPFADEFVAITVDPEMVLRGERPNTVILGWDAILVGPEGDSIATLLANGVPPPTVGDSLLLFLAPVDPAFADFLKGVPTHQLVQLDGIAFLDDAGAIVGAEDGSPLADAGTVADLRSSLPQ